MRQYSENFYNSMDREWDFAKKELLQSLGHHSLSDSSNLGLQLVPSYSSDIIMRDKGKSSQSFSDSMFVRYPKKSDPWSKSRALKYATPIVLLNQSKVKKDK